MKLTPDRELANMLAEITAWFGHESIKETHAKLLRAEKMLKRLAPDILRHHQEARKEAEEATE